MEGLHPDHLISIIDAEFLSNGVAGHHINSFNNLISGDGLVNIITQGFSLGGKIINNRTNTDEDNRIESIEYFGTFTNITIHSPVHIVNNVRELTFPSYCLKHNLTYSAAIYANVEISHNYKLKPAFGGNISETKTAIIKDIKLGNIPIVVKSDKCNLNKLSDQELKEIGEDPSDPGGYFIIKGNEKAIIALENVPKNEPQIHKNITNNEFVRCEFISQPGDGFENSHQIKIFITNYYGILLELILSKDKSLIFPFYTLFRIFGVIEDKALMELIIYDLESKNSINEKIIDFLSSAMTTYPDYEHFWTLYNPVEICAELWKQIEKETLEINLRKKSKNTINQQKDVNIIMERLDKYVFPHIGQTQEFRYEKLLMLGHLINKTLKVFFGVLDPTDRDRATKSYYPAGPTISKTIKTVLNTGVIQPANNAINQAFQTTTYSMVNVADIFIASLADGSSLEIGLEKSINSATPEIKIKTITMTNRVDAHALDRKNQINAYLVLRSIGTTTGSMSKKSDKTLKSRGTHPSYWGKIDILQSVEGAKAGTIKQMTLMTSITESFSSAVLKDLIRTLIIPINQVKLSDINKFSLVKVFVNGHLLGFHSSWKDLTNLLRNMRREGKINPKVSICCDTVFTGDVNIWTYMGRLISPTIIVYNNYEEFKKGKEEFKQWIKFTPQMHYDLLNKKISINDLVEMQVLEYISIQELDNCYMCPGLKILLNNQNNYLMQFTHLNIEQEIFGLSILTTPFLDYSATVRSTYQGNQRKQTLGYYSLNWFNRFDKGKFIQFGTQFPLVFTMANKYVRSDGCNVSVAIHAAMDNEEDSEVGNSAIFQRGLYSGNYYNVYETTLEMGEEFSNPDPKTIQGIKNKSFSHLEQGIIKNGTVLHKNDIIIGKVYHANTKGTNEVYDKSIIHKKKIPVTVDDVLVGYNADYKKHCKVRNRSFRPVEIGDKFSARSGNKAIISTLENEDNLIYCSDGQVPDMILNPHGFPTRMVYNQFKEGIFALWCIYTGQFYDATVFKQIDEEKILKDLEEFGVRADGTRIMVNGKTGNVLPTRIFICPTFYQRLDKMIQDNNNAVGVVDTNILTRQPVKGIGKSGGSKLGEMEKDSIGSYGACNVLHEKFFNHSDGEKLPVCKGCGNFMAIEVTAGKVFKCNICRDNTDPVMIDSCHTSKVFLDHLNSAGGNINLDLEKPHYEFQYNEQ